MFGFFKRMFKYVESEANSAVSKLEDPIKMTEQGVHDLKSDLEESLKNLAEVKAIQINLKRQLEERKQIAADYENKAMLLLQKAQNNELSQADADRLATEALTKKNQATADVTKFTTDLANQEKLTAQLEDKIRKLKSQITSWENELTTLKARAKIATSTKKINQQLAQLNSDSTVTMLENMKTKVAEEEALAQAYDDVKSVGSSADEEINKALEGSTPNEVADSLAELKSRLTSKKD